jgi:23S rRNA (guanine745-N1)-methyltransferase
MPAYRCPVCGSTLIADEAGFECADRHRFDRAREGYVNLLPGGRLKGRPAGDSEAMVRARRTVFDAGLYRPITDSVAEVVAEVVAGRNLEPPTVLDCGCGEGSYLAAVCSRADTVGVAVGGWGVDVSKPAVRLAARRHRSLHFAVASSYALPFADDSFGAVLSVFSPRPFGEMTRVLAPDGVAVLVTPGADHLHQLKALIYDDPRAHAEPGDVADSEWTAPREVRPVRFDVRLDEPALRTALLEMTPFWWSTPAERRHVIAESACMVTIDMRIAIHRPDTLES